MPTITSHNTPPVDNGQISTSIQSHLLERIAAAAKAVLDFLIILFLGLVLALLTILPWLLRVSAVLLWLVGGYVAMIAIRTIYAPFSNGEELLALQFVVIFLMTALVMILFMGKQAHLWGGLAFGGFLAYILATNAVRVANMEYADLIFRVLPPALLSVGMITAAIRLKALRSEHNLRFGSPPFVWINKLLSKGGGAIDPKQ